MEPKHIRIAVGLSAVKVARLARKSRQTIRIYELDRDAVEPTPRRELDEVYDDLRQLLERRRSEPPPHAA